MPDFTTETARRALARSWAKDPQGVAELVRRVIARAPALSPEQREAVRAALALPAHADQPGGDAA